MYVLRVEGLSKNFGALRALSNVDISVERHEIRAIIGPNGAGKTTLFNVICGNLPSSAGRIFLFEDDITFMPTYRRAQLGLGRTFQITSGFFNLSVFRNIMLALQSKAVKFGAFRPIDKDLVHSANQLLGRFPCLDEKRDLLVKDLCYGEQRQIDLILGLASNSEVILLDEPMAGLSTAESSAMITTIRSLAENCTVVMIEHDIDVVLELADRITVLHEGKVLADGDKEHVRTDQRVREVYTWV